MACDEKSGCGDGSEVAAQGVLDDLPIVEVKLLLDMVLGNTPFDFVKAIDAVAVIAKYAAALDLFSAQAEVACPKAVGAAVLLQAVVANEKACGGGGIEAQGIWDIVPKKWLLELLIRNIMEWLAEQVNKSA